MQTETPQSEMMSKQDAYRILRMFVRIEQQIDRAADMGRYDDARCMAQMTGALEVKIFGGFMHVEEVA